MEDSILSAVGSPLVRIPGPTGSTVAAKVEAANPGGSVKVRPAITMIRAAESRDDLTAGDRIVEATSGNTGIGLSLVAAVEDYNITIVLPESTSEERQTILEAYGADVVRVSGGMNRATERAEGIAEETGGYLVSQFENSANPGAHYATTGEELLEQVEDRTIDAFVAPVGTGGTITGTAKRLRESFPDLLVAGVEPAANPFLSTGTPSEHDFQGMGPDFIPQVLDRDVIDRVESVSLDRAEEECRTLARTEGLLVGQSSGAAAVAARRVASDLLEEHTDPLVVTIFPDSGERYLSVGVFD
ncbi:MAG: PLP-dependent cysteine synthase family protein [Halodesulfurarchaeum sp.]